MRNGYSKARFEGGLWICGAENEARTRDPQLGKLMLYQLSYFRVCWGKGNVFLNCSQKNAPKKCLFVAELHEIQLDTLVEVAIEYGLHIGGFVAAA